MTDPDKKRKNSSPDSLFEMLGLDELFCLDVSVHVRTIPYIPCTVVVMVSSVDVITRCGELP